MKLLLWLISLSLTAGCLAASPAKVPVPPGFASWSIAYVRDGSIWTARADGHAQKLIIRNAGAPCWSGDRSKIAFYRDGNIWVANADGTSQRQLTHYGKSHSYKQSYVTITWNRRTGGLTFSRPDEIRASGAGGRGWVQGMSILDLHPLSGKKQVLSVRFDVADRGTGFNFADNENPAWSKSGEMLAFTRNGDIWVAQYYPGDGEGGRAGWDVSRLATVAQYDSPTYRGSRENLAATSLSWSPDGTHLAYSLNRIDGSGVAQLHAITVHTNGTPWPDVTADAKLLDDFTESGTSLSWQPEDVCFSPDGKWIAFSSVESIYAISIDGKQVVKLISHGTRPVW